MDNPYPYAAKGILWYEGWNALNSTLAQHNLMIGAGERETFVVVLDHATWTHYTTSILAKSFGDLTSNPEDKPSLPPMNEYNSYSEAVTAALNEMIRRIKEGK